MRAALDHHIEANAGVRGGKPCLAGTRVAVADIVLMHLRMGMSLEQIAGRYDLALSALHAAMACYYDNRDEIDRQMSEEDAFVQSQKAASHSKLQAKLRAAGCD